MAKKRGLGKGLDALLSSVSDVEDNVSTQGAESLDGYRFTSC